MLWPVVKQWLYWHSQVFLNALSEASGVETLEGLGGLESDMVSFSESNTLVKRDKMMDGAGLSQSASIS